jgi:predicted RecA/RadA family phage recombinase
VAQNFIQPGDVIDYTAGGTITSGDVLFSGILPGIALISGVSGDIIPMQIRGVFQVDKTTSLVISQGDKLYFNTGTKKVTKTNTDKYIGVAVTAEISAATTVQVLLTPDTNAVTNQAAVVAANATANGSDAATTQALANSLKTTVNNILTELKAAGLMASA